MSNNLFNSTTIYIPLVNHLSVIQHQYSTYCAIDVLEFLIAKCHCQMFVHRLVCNVFCVKQHTKHRSLVSKLIFLFLIL